MLVRSTQPDTEPALARSPTLRVLLWFYVLPVVIGSLCSLTLLSWLLILTGISSLTAAALAAVLGAVGTILIEEVVHDE